MNIEGLKALIAAKKLIPPIIKDSLNPYYKSNYASLGNILEIVEPILLNHGLLIVYTNVDNADENCLVLHIYHESSEEPILSSRYYLGKNLIGQDKGKAITYARRYSLASMLNLNTDQDDDGNSLLRRGDDTLPFSNVSESIAWAASYAKISEEEAKIILHSTEADKEGRKATNFFNNIKKLNKGSK